MTRAAVILLSIMSHIESSAADVPDVPCAESPLATAYCECGIELVATRKERDGARAVVVEREAERDGLKLTLTECTGAWRAEEQAHAVTKAKRPAQIRVAIVGGAVLGAAIGYGVGTLVSGARR